MLQSRVSFGRNLYFFQSFVGQFSESEIDGKSILIPQQCFITVFGFHGIHWAPASYFIDNSYSYCYRHESRWKRVVTAALLIGCDGETFTPPSSFQWIKICPDILAVCFCNCISAKFLPSHFTSVRNYLLILVFPVSNWTGLLQITQYGIFICIQFNPIGKQIEDKDICPRPVHAKYRHLGSLC